MDSATLKPRVCFSTSCGMPGGLSAAVRMPGVQSIESNRRTTSLEASVQRVASACKSSHGMGSTTTTLGDRSSQDAPCQPGRREALRPVNCNFDTITLRLKRAETTNCLCTSSRAVASSFDQKVVPGLPFATDAQVARELRAAPHKRPMQKKQYDI